MKKLVIAGVVFLGVSLSYQGFSQGFLRKLKDRAEDKVIDEIFDKKNDESGGSEGYDGASGSDESASGTRNTRGGGLVVTPPDVNENIEAASSAFKAKNYGDSRHAIRQALLGVEMEIGHKTLESLPESVNNLKKIPEQDKVTSSGIGFVGLIIERQYAGGDQELKLIIGNDAAWLSTVNMYLANSGYATSSSDQNYKQVKFQDYRGVLEYDEYSGYKLSVPFGQSSVFVLEGINFANENELMTAGNKFDLNAIKNQLGEN